MSNAALHLQAHHGNFQHVVLLPRAWRFTVVLCGCSMCSKVWLIGTAESIRAISRSALVQGEIRRIDTSRANSCPIHALLRSCLFAHMAASGHWVCSLGRHPGRKRLLHGVPHVSVLGGALPRFVCALAHGRLYRVIPSPLSEPPVSVAQSVRIAWLAWLHGPPTATTTRSSCSKHSNLFELDVARSAHIQQRKRRR